LCFFSQPSSKHKRLSKIAVLILYWLPEMACQP
jgi:hypothetical protein